MQDWREEYLWPRIQSPSYIKFLPNFYTIWGRRSENLRGVAPTSFPSRNVVEEDVMSLRRTKGRVSFCHLDPYDGTSWSSVNRNFKISHSADEYLRSEVDINSETCGFIGAEK
ncbi:hypothetical protein X798_01947 [Onchocerca flexuosa]|uniref:Ovule protein n=2 Tax=Onchocerca flexuosa TaxID=387005 RepID=A0A183H6Y6_9BILA|nr:hypothetical protein X798_01947 [Onchocerca flexuosa]VDO35806.1 unnamed protein product [Onchocerca flexuosa]